jgi:hypothetical protein
MSTHDHDPELEDENGHAHDHDHDEEGGCGAEMMISDPADVFLQMREQNIELLKLAVKVAGFSGEHTPIKRNEVQNVLKSIWDVYVELYEWIDPEADGDEDEEDEDEE